MYLGALKVNFPHPVTGNTLEIKSSIEKDLYSKFYTIIRKTDVQNYYTICL